MNKKICDSKAVIQVIGSIYQNPELLDNEQYSFNEDDFPMDFHKVMFGSIYNLHALGAKSITVNTIEEANHYYSNKLLEFCPDCCNEFVQWFEKKGNLIDLSNQLDNYK